MGTEWKKESRKSDVDVSLGFVHSPKPHKKVVLKGKARRARRPPPRHGAACVYRRAPVCRRTRYVADQFTVDNCGILHASVKQAVAPHTLLTLAAELDPIGSKHKFGIAAKVLR